MVVLDKASEALAEAPQLQEPPPSYSQSETTAKPESTVVQPPIPKPLNFVSVVRRDKSIKACFAIDPKLFVPPSLLPRLSEGESEADRKNLHLESKDGSIDVDVWLVGDAGDDDVYKAENKRTALDVKSHDGAVSVRIHVPTNTSTRAPFKLNALSKDGQVTVHIPRSFLGPLTITARDGTINVSDEIKRQVTTMSEVNKTKRCFVGEFAGSKYWESDGSWNGDEVEVNAKDGRVKIQYDDEVKIKSKKKGSFFGQMIGEVFGQAVWS